MGKFQKGNKGKPKGALNKTTRTVREVFSDVFTELQADKKANLKDWAKENPTEFYKLSSKLIPSDIKAEVTGADGQPFAAPIINILPKTDD